MMQRVSAVDLFCGAGGLSHGLILEEIVVRAGIDIDPQCRYPFEHNNKCSFLQRDIEKLTGIELIKIFEPGELKVLVGCAPCQPFSTYTQGRTPVRDSRWKLLRSFLRLVQESKPEIVSMENVPQISRHPIYRSFIGGLEKLGYSVSANVVFCPYYGIPQARKRLVLLASKFGPINLLPPTHSRENFVTVRETIGNLPPLGAGESAQCDPIHCASGLSAKNLRRIKSSKPGGSWRDWNTNLVSGCHKRSRGSKYPSVYGRMEWDKPSPTITTQCYGFGSGRFGHPSQNRAISLREAALLQTFPCDYEFVEPNAPVQFKSIGRLIGNAVPVQLGRVIAKSIKVHLDIYAHRISASSTSRRRIRNPQ